MSWLRSYALLVRWNAMRLRFLLPLFVIVQAGLAVGVIVGFAYLLPSVDRVSALYLATGGTAGGLIAVGFVIAPQMVAQAKIQGSFEFDRSLPVPRTAAIVADMTPWILGTLPGLALALMIAMLRFDLDLRVSPLVVPATLLVAVTATAIGYGIAYALPPTAVTLLSQLLVFFTLMFSPVNFPAERLPGWLQAVHDVLPLQYMAQLIRETLVVPATGVSPVPFAVLAAWCVAGCAVTYRVANHRP